MISPLLKIRREYNLSLPLFAQLCQTSVSTISLAERGITRLPVKVEEALQSLGFDTNSIRQQHDDFMRQAYEGLRRDVKRREAPQ